MKSLKISELTSMGSKWGQKWGHLTYFTNLGVIFGVKTGVKWVKNGNFSSFSDIL